MITLEATIICDTCKQIIASSCGNYARFFEAAEDAQRRARTLGAIVGLTQAKCKDCHAKSTTTTPTVWVIEEKP